MDIQGMSKMWQKWTFSKNVLKQFFSRSRLQPLAQPAAFIFCYLIEHVGLLRPTE
jgi:hypothetical protein